MQEFSIDISGLRGFLKGEEISALQPEVHRAHKLLVEKNGPGAEFLGWLDLPTEAAGQVGQIREVAEKIRSTSECLVVIGIGGSYLGSAAISGLGSSFSQLRGNPRVLFAGHNLSSAYHADLLTLLAPLDFSVNVISKSGTTAEPAIAFRLLKDLLAKKYGREGAQRRIYATTGSKGALWEIAQQKGYETFLIPEDLGGRFSVLSPVGLLPAAVAGIDIEEMLAGARQGQGDFLNPDLSLNPCYLYAAIRNLLYRQGKAVELLVTYEPGLHYFSEWWKQLFGESEGKEGKGLFPAAATFSTDLHSLGQFIQEGRKLLFETIIRVKESPQPLLVPQMEGDLDGFNYLAGKSFEYINGCIHEGVAKAHSEEGMVPVLTLNVPKLTEWTLGYLFYFMEKACAISGYLLGVNPFSQPGVEAYKRHMLALLKE